MCDGLSLLIVVLGDGFSESGSLFVFYAKGNNFFVHLLVSQEVSMSPTSFWMQDIFLVILRHINTNERNFSFTYLIFLLIIIIIMSHHQHGSPWPSPTIHLYRPLLPVGLQGYIQYRHRPVAYRFLLVVQPLFVHVKGPTGECHLWVYPYFSSSVPLVWFI